jgi:hypothetical protein
VLKAGKGLNDSKVELRVQFHSVPGVVDDLEPKPLHAYAHHGASLFPTGVVDDLEHCVANEL